MPRILLLFVLALAGADRAPGQEAAAGSTEPATVEAAANSSEAIIGLLKLSHDQDQALSPPVRLYTLRMQAQAMLPLDAELARVWTEEMSRLSLEQASADRDSAKKFSLEMLAGSEPERTLVLLHSMKTEEAGTGHYSQWSKLSITTQAFTAIVRRDGAGALPKLEEEATRFGVEGQYPYKAMGQAVVQSVNGDWGKDDEHAKKLVTRVFEEMYALYSRESHGYPDDFEFGQMLEVVSGALPAETVRPAVRELVTNLSAMDVHKYQPVVEVSTNDGQKVKSEDGSDAGILFFGGVIQRVDPELAQELEATRPGLRNLAYTKDGRQASISLGWKNLHPRDEAEELRLDAVGLSHVNSDAAIAKMAQLPDDERKEETKLDVARGIAENDPEKASQLIGEVKWKIEDDAASLNMASARAFAAAAEGKNEEVHEYLRQGFAAADRVFAAQERTGNLRLAAGLPQMVQLGTQYDLDMTTAFVQNLPASYAKALLFFGMANALEGAGGVQRREKAAE